MLAEAQILSADELAQISDRGRAIYDQTLKAVLEPQYNGQVVAIHLDTGDYEVAKNSPSAWKTLRSRRSHGFIVITDIGPARMDSLTYRMIANKSLAGESK